MLDGILVLLPTGREFFIPARTLIGVKPLTVAEVI